ncbi:hypothetical protein [Paenibacillus pini]|uniref:Uncharacterized protein n=1 Tax=Paenibacillus pini JCM 16418 TaxID=1236976 RepID=W7YWE4_9BACL|nr:hypothetical protein [Paenibacillus pini]GAF08986.1 hypothetical protein JCM16418_3099 [Paenibacillus pini JCM 16418]
MVINDNTSEVVEIDTIVNFIKMASTFENWDKVISLSTSLLDSATEIIHTDKNTIQTKKKRHISYYFGYSYLMKGIAFQKLSQYLEAKECISYYSDLSWLYDSTEESATIIADFKLFSKANSLTIEILMGNREKTLEYVEFIKENPDQVLSGLSH